MTLHRIIVVVTLAVTSVSALVYLSGFPVEGQYPSARDQRVDQRVDRQEPVKPSQLPAGGVENAQA